MHKMILHCGANEVNLAGLKHIPTPAPSATHYPIPHNVLVDTVTRALNGAGHEVVAQGHAVTKDGADYFGTMELEQAESCDYSTIVGLRNSHKKRFPAGIACGARVMVCDNLSFSGEVVAKRRHTKFIMRDLDQLITASIGRLAMMREDQETRMAKYKDTEIDRVFADHLVVELLRNRIVPSSRLQFVINEWEAPSHEEFTEHGYSAWRFFNAVTETLKGFIPNPKKTQALHGLLDAAVGGVELKGDYSPITV